MSLFILKFDTALKLFSAMCISVNLKLYHYTYTYFCSQQKLKLWANNQDFNIKEIEELVLINIY